MDMYQKREQRKKNKTEENNTENTNKVNINWDIGTNRQHHSNPYKIRILSN